MRIKKLSLISVVGFLSVTTLGVCAESVSQTTAPITVPAEAPVGTTAKPPAIPGAGPRSLSSMMIPQPSLTPEENKILAQARMELQKDPEIQDLTTQIKALMEKRAKLSDEKLQKISPEAATIAQKLKDYQEKMQAERRAQMEAMQAKRSQHAVSTDTTKAENIPPAAPAVTPPSVP